MEQSKIARLNQLARKAKNETLSPSETEERDVLRKEYIESFKTGLKSTLERVRIQEADGSLTPLKKRTKPHHHHHENCSCGCCRREEEETPKQ
ncbi:MAG TPA: DUF896 domain-containing protein [Clostridiales bacterium]|nr:DUF896 domain-containing protein [Clostridiales bacterium]